jgi:hypothetical protein
MALDERETPVKRETLKVDTSHFAKIHAFVSRIGDYYGTDDWSVFMYSMVKMHRPLRLLELGTGLGASALMMGEALRQNGEGFLYTVDRGYKWHEKMAEANCLTAEERRETHAEYFQATLDRFALNNQVKLLTNSFPPFPMPFDTLDLLFSDYQHQPDKLLSILGFYLPRMASPSSIFIDSAPSFLPSYLLLRELCDMFRHGRLPRLLLKRVRASLVPRLERFIHENTIEFVPMVENKSRSQNSTAWLRIQPVDIAPRPLGRYRLDHKFYLSGDKL